MTSYRLFYSPGACSLASHIVLEELGVAYEAERVVIAEGENQTPAYKAINPRGRVPALAMGAQGDARVLTESIAILVYLGQTHPHAGLLPAAPEAFARMLEWMSWLASTVHQTGIRTILKPERFTEDAASAAAIAARGRTLVQDSYRDLEARLLPGQYAIGDRFSVLDAYLLVFYRWGNRVGFDMRREFPRYAALMDTVRARPAVARVIEQEGIQIDQ
ncbi:glutathione S-transferase family protein [Sinimarinibacterium sp. NLF-5-8]|uniref:glutathione S-transferase family protein n=1 Tax=Sinimarinibacterium sp. NLF-5-8 TaxID=2698684 RepID=UPI00137C0561|nr:glutathione S-transferase N-terminal domain-containing protein [Sinimarinibacterium sp. NLF-5-8]QHS11095.1 glutathione S-transferase [Sinimarinibacterium sp. NLF-5-8]